MVKSPNNKRKSLPAGGNKGPQRPQKPNQKAAGKPAAPKRSQGFAKRARDNSESEVAVPTLFKRAPRPNEPNRKGKKRENSSEAKAQGGPRPVKLNKKAKKRALSLSGDSEVPSPKLLKESPKPIAANKKITKPKSTKDSSPGKKESGEEQKKRKRLYQQIQHQIKVGNKGVVKDIDEKIEKLKKSSELTKTALRKIKLLEKFKRKALGEKIPDAPKKKENPKPLSENKKERRNDYNKKKRKEAEDADDDKPAETLLQKKKRSLTELEDKIKSGDKVEIIKLKTSIEELKKRDNLSKRAQKKLKWLEKMKCVANGESPAAKPKKDNQKIVQKGKKTVVTKKVEVVEIEEDSDESDDEEESGDESNAKEDSADVEEEESDDAEEGDSDEEDSDDAEEEEDGSDDEASSD